MNVKPNQYLCEHIWRLDRSGKPLVAPIAIIAFEKAPPAMHPEENVWYPNAGWKRIEKEALVEPKAAKEAKAKKDSSLDKLERLAKSIESEEVK